MSDPMMAPPAQKPMGSPNAITRNMSPLNTADVTMQAQTGQISKDMSMKQWLENTYKLSVEAPFQQWLPALKAGIQNRDAVGKARSIATQGGAPRTAPAPAQGAPLPPRGTGRDVNKPGGVEALMGMMGGK